MANVKISELAAASSVEAGDLLEISEDTGGGTYTSKRVTASQLRTYAIAGTGTVSSVAVSGGTTGLTTSGGPVTSSGTITLGGTLAVANGGTGATDAGTARTNLGLGSIATQAASNVAITGGSVTGITDLAIADGGTGASTASAARSNLGAAASGTNSDITSLTGLTTALSVAQGGTGATTAETALSNLGGLPLAGGTLTGALAVTAGTVSAPGLTTSGDTNTGMFFPAADTIAFAEGGVEVMRLDSAARVGIGMVPLANNGVLQVGGYASVQTLIERATISAIAASGTINFDAATQAVLYYTSNSTANWTLNIRGSASLTLNSMLQTGQSLTFVFLATNGSTAFRATALQVDSVSVTPRWQGGTAPASGNANSIDVYSYTIIKTANATFTALASLTRFA